MTQHEDPHVVRLFPGPPESVPLRGLYLQERLRPQGGGARPCVFANFITSLDGRISLLDPRKERRSVPPAIANERDWRLFQELAASADVLVTSGRHARNLRHPLSARSFPLSGRPAYSDLHDWRAARGLTPQPAIVFVTASLELPALAPLVESGRTVYVATGSKSEPRKAAQLEAQGVRVLRAGAGTHVEGGGLVEALAREGHSTVGMIGGGEVLRALVADGVLDRLYLTLACRLLGGASFDTLLTGAELDPAAQLELAALHYDAGAADGSKLEQLFAVFDRPV